MIVLEVADLVVIVGRTLGLDTERALDLLDPAAAELALGQVRPDSDPGDLARPAAVLLCALVRNSRCGTATGRSRWRPCCSSWPSTARRWILTRPRQSRP